MILVVEDEPLIRMTAVGMIEEAGYRATEASSGDQALRLLESGMGFTALFTDVNLRGDMTGLALAQTVRDGWPEMRVVLTSGRFEPAVQKLPRGVVFLPKPYSMSALHEALGLTRLLTSVAAGSILSIGLESGQMITSATV